MFPLPALQQENNLSLINQSHLQVNRQESFFYNSHNITLQNIREEQEQNQLNLFERFSHKTKTDLNNIKINLDIIFKKDEKSFVESFVVFTNYFLRVNNIINHNIPDNVYIETQKSLTELSFIIQKSIHKTECKQLIKDSIVLLSTMNFDNDFVFNLNSLITQLKLHSGIYCAETSNLLDEILKKLLTEFLENTLKDDVLQQVIYEKESLVDYLFIKAKKYTRNKISQTSPDIYFPLKKLIKSDFKKYLQINYNLFSICRIVSELIVFELDSILNKEACGNLEQEIKSCLMNKFSLLGIDTSKYLLKSDELIVKNKSGITLVDNHSEMIYLSLVEGLAKGEIKQLCSILDYNLMTYDGLSFWLENKNEKKIVTLTHLNKINILEWPSISSSFIYQAIINTVNEKEILEFLEISANQESLLKVDTNVRTIFLNKVINFCENKEGFKLSLERFLIKKLELIPQCELQTQPLFQLFSNVPIILPFIFKLSKDIHVVKNILFELPSKVLSNIDKESIQKFFYDDYKQIMSKAISEGCIQLVHKVLDIDSPSVIHCQTTQKQTLLHFAIQSSDNTLLNLCLASEHFNIHQQETVFGYSPLLLCALNDDVTTLELIMSHKYFIDKNMLACDNKGRNAISLAALSGSENVLDYLLHKGNRRLLAVIDKDGNSPLHHACIGSHDKCLTLLLECGFLNINAKNFQGRTPLMIAAEQGDLKSVNALIRAKVDVNLSNKKGYTALHLSAKHGHLDCVNALLAAGANVNCHNIKRRTPLHMSAKHGHPAVIKRLTEVENVHINHKDMRLNTAFDYASKRNFSVSKNLLLDANKQKRPQCSTFDVDET